MRQRIDFSQVFDEAIRGLDPGVGMGLLWQPFLALPHPHPNLPPEGEGMFLSVNFMTQ